MNKHYIIRRKTIHFNFKINVGGLTVGFRFRKSMKIGKNTRVNFGKTGVGLSFGAKGLRRTLHSSGRKTTSAGIPGSGLYYTKSSIKKAGSRSKIGRASCRER